MTDLELEALWDQLKKAEEFHQEISPAKFNLLLNAGMLQLWVEPDPLNPVAVMVTEIRDTLSGKYVFINAFAGKNVDVNRKMFASIKNWAAKNSCTAIRAVCRDAQARLFSRDGFSKVANVIELEV